MTNALEAAIAAALVGESADLDALRQRHVELSASSASPQLPDAVDERLNQLARCSMASRLLGEASPRAALASSRRGS